MAEGEMTVVYTYDVQCPRRRRRVAEALERRATRVQKSVFETVTTKRRACALLARVERELAPGDSLRMYAVGAAGLRWSRQVGGAPIQESDAYWLV